MLGSSNLEEHGSLILLVLNVVHEDESLGLFSLFARFPLFFDLMRIQKVALLRELLRVNEAHGDLLLQEPLIGPLQVILLVALVFRVDDLTKHLLQAVEQLLHEAEVNSEACLDLFLLGCWALLTVALLLNVELDEP